MVDDDETLRTEPTPDPRRPTKELTTFKPTAQRFVLGQELGRGGMGQVLAARDVSLKRGVAIKKVLSVNEVDLDRFDREVRITAELEHPSIVAIHDVGLDDEGRPFYVMRQIRGEPLSDRLTRLPTLAGRLALLPNLLAAADAAAFAHARRILHRDIKPSNILLGEYGETLLIDWGLARRVDEIEPKIPEAADSLPGGTLTLAGHVYGTLGYMAPEQARGEVVDARADVFALGATLFHLLAGAGPYHTVSPGERIQAAVEEHPPPFERLPQDAPSDLHAIVRKAMAVDPAQRYPDAGALAADLRAFLEGQLVGAHRYSVGERARRFVRKHRVAIAIGAISVIALIAIGVIAILSVIDERSEKLIADREATRERERAEDQAQQVLLSDASLLAESDPARAIATLRHLDPKSPYGRRARDIAIKASARGIPRGDLQHEAPVTALQLSRDLVSLASGDDRGRVVLRTLQPKLLRRAELGAPIDRLEWLDDRTVVAFTRKGRLVELGLGPSLDRELAPGRVIGMFAIVGDKLVVVDKQLHQLLEIDRQSGTMRVLARDVDVVIARGTSIAISGSTGLRWLRPDREVALSPTPVSKFELAISMDGRRAAAASGNRVREWDADGRELHAWEVAFPFQLIYTATRLYVLTVSSTLMSLGPSVTHTAIKRGQIIAVVATDSGLAVTFKDGSASLVDGDLPRDLPLVFPRALRSASDPSASLLAMGSEAGEVRWWNLSAVLPRRVYDNDLLPCALDARSAYYITTDALVVMDRKTLERREISAVPQAVVMQCRGVLRDQRVVLQNFRGGWVVDVRTGRSQHVTDRWIEIAHDTDSVLFSRDRQLVELVHGAGEPRVWWTAKAPVAAARSSGRWIAARSSDGALVRIDRETGTVDQVTTWPGPFHIGPAGEVWYATDRWLWRWTDRGHSPVTSAAGPILSLNSDGQPLLLQLHDGSLWTVTSDGVIRHITSTTAKFLLAGPREYVVFAPSLDRIIQYGLKSGERIQRVVMAAPLGAVVAPDESSLMVRSGPSSTLIYSDSVPDNLRDMAGWLDAATNARLDRKTDLLSWPVD